MNDSVNIARFFYFVVIGIIIFLVALYYVLMRLRHYKRFKKDCNNPEISKYIDLIQPVLIRRFQHRQNYFWFQIVEKVFGFASVAFSLMAFLVIAVETDAFTEFLIAFTAVVCVIIALYITPHDRISEYNRSAKFLDDKFLEICGNIISDINDGLSDEKIKLRINDSVSCAIREAEKIVKSDEQ